MEKVLWRPSQFQRLYFLVVFADCRRNSGCDAGIKIRPTNEELLSMSPEFDHRWSTYFENARDKPAMLVLSVAGWVHFDCIPTQFELTGHASVMVGILTCLPEITLA